MKEILKKSPKAQSYIEARKTFILMISGILGGILYSISLNKKIELLAWSEESIVPGVIEDILVGITGAFIVAATPLNEFIKYEINPAAALITSGIVGGYADKALINSLLGRLVQRIETLEQDKKEAIEQKQELAEKVGELEEDQGTLLAGGSLIDQVNEQIFSEAGLSATEVSELKQKIQAAPSNVKERVFTIAKEVRSMGWKARSLKLQIKRTIPIFEALVASDEKKYDYYAQLAYAYKDSDPPHLEKAISYLDKAIQLRGTQFQDTTWKYELNRAIIRILREEREIHESPVNGQAEEILKDLLIVDQTYGLARVLREADDNDVDIPIKDWLNSNKAWVQARSDAKSLLSIVPPTSQEVFANGKAATLLETSNGGKSLVPATLLGTPDVKPSLVTTTLLERSDVGTTLVEEKSLVEKITVKPDRWDIALANAPTAGASAKTARQDGLPPGIASSHKMAEKDLQQIRLIEERFYKAGVKFDVPPAILAALASRESRCGKVLDSRGYGDRGNAFGIMQVDRRYHQQAGAGGDPKSQQHIDQATEIFARYCKQVRANHPSWEDKYILKGAAVAYNSGVGNIHTKEGMDRGTTGDDYGSDIIARAQFFDRYLKSLAECKLPQARNTASKIVIPQSTEAIQDILEDVDEEIPLSEWDPELVAAVQAGLIRLKFLDAPGDLSQLRRAWAKFKTRTSQGEPELIGPGSAQLLLDLLGAPHPVSPEQLPKGNAAVNSKAGSRTGKSKKFLWNNQTVYQNEFIMPGVPLTWGECTNGMDEERWLTQKWQVDNAIRLAQVFGEVRRKYGSPIIITSGFRPEPANSKVGGKKYSQHILFKALDLCPQDRNFKRLLQVLRDTPSIKAIGRGERKGFLHIDIRDENAPPGFRYSGKQFEFPY